jgi:hypothetical protein
MTPLESARAWIERGCYPVPVAHATKDSLPKGWPNLRLTAENVGEYFSDKPSNVGVLLGIDGLTDIDLDSPYAVKVARDLLPHTDCAFGHAPSKPWSHAFFVMDKPCASIRRNSPLTGKMLAELRCAKRAGGAGLYTVVPESIHEETAEQVRFEPGRDGKPTPISIGRLRLAYDLITAGALFAEQWPAAGEGRNHCEMAFAGAFVREGWELDATTQFLLAIYKAIDKPDPSAYSRVVNSVRATYHGYETHGEVTGWPALLEHIGKPAIDAIQAWMGIETAKARPAMVAGGLRRDAELAGDGDSPDLDSTPYSEVLAMPDTSTSYIVEGLIPRPCLAILAGQPKGGKSWMALQLAVACAKAQPYLGWFTVPTAGRVLYLALEEHPGRTRNRGHLLGCKPDDPQWASIDMVYAGKLLPLMAGGLEQLDRKLDNADPRYDLVIIDTKLAAVQRTESGKDPVRADYQEMNVLHRLAEIHDVAIVMIDHTRKGEGDNALHNVQGTTGVTAAADSVFVLKRASNGKKAILNARGRETEEENYGLEREPNSPAWFIKEAGSTVGMSEERVQVLRFLHEEGPQSPKAIAAELKKAPASVRWLVKRMLQKEQIRKQSDGKYALAKPFVEDAAEL